MHLVPYDYLNMRDEGHRGLVTLAPLIEQARAEVAACVLCDSGDFLQGTPLADEIAARRTLPHPMMQAFATLGYDAITLGNHDFDYGLPYLKDVLTDARPAIVSANIRTGPTQSLVAPWAMLTRHLSCGDGVEREIRIGVIGFAPPQITAWNADILDDALQTDDILAAARTHLPQLRRAGADLVVALCHGGPVAGPPVCHMENAALQLAALPGIDVVLMGHMHGLFPGPGFAGIAEVDCQRGTLAGKPAVMAGGNGGAIGVIDLTLTPVAPAPSHPDAKPGRRWQVTGHDAQIRKAPTDRFTPTPLYRSLRQVLAGPHDATLARMAEPIGATDRPLTTYFAAIGRDDTAPLLAQVQIDAIRAALTATPFADLPILASTAPFHAGAHGGPSNYLGIAAGPLRVRDCRAMVPFDNPICAMLRRGWQIRQWLERSNAFFNRITPGLADQPLLNCQIAPYHFDTLHGITYTVDLSCPNGPETGRIRDLRLGGRPLCDDTLCIVATNSYRAHGGGGLVIADPSDTIHVTRRGLRDLLIAALASGTPPTPDATSPWTFAPIPGASALFPGSPAQEARAATGEGVTFAGMRDDGFAAYRLTF